MKKLKKVFVLTLIASLVLSISAQGKKATITAKKAPANVRTIKFKGTGKRLNSKKGKNINKTCRFCYSKQKEISNSNIYDFQQKSSICFKKGTSEGIEKRNPLRFVQCPK